MTAYDCRIDRLRLLACFGVVMLHSSAGSEAGFDDLALNALFRFSVPAFVIISGWLYLAKPVSTGHLVKKSAALFGRLLLWSGIYLFYGGLYRNMWPEDPLTYLLTEPVHLWYLYATMGLYLLTPALQPFVRSAERREYRYALGICFGVGCVVMTLVRLEWFPALAVILDKSKLPDMLGFLYLYLLGGYFRKFGFVHPRRWMWIGLTCAVFNMVAAQTAYDQQFLSFIAPNVVLSGGACFVLYMTRKPLDARWNGYLRQAAGCTMGVYLLHTMVSDYLTPMLRPFLALLLPSLAMVVRCLCIFNVTFAAVWLLCRIPPVKKYLM